MILQYYHLSFCYIFITLGWTVRMIHILVQISLNMRGNSCGSLNGLTKEGLDVEIEGSYYISWAWEEEMRKERIVQFWQLGGSLKKGRARILYEALWDISEEVKPWYQWLPLTIEICKRYFIVIYDGIDMDMHRMQSKVITKVIFSYCTQYTML